MFEIRYKKAFTLIELLIVVAVIGILAGVVLVSAGSARLKSRDARRIIGMKSIQSALEVYLLENGRYPLNTDDDCSGWDTGNKDDSVFINSLSGIIPVDSTAVGTCGGYRYYRYGAGSSGCPVGSGAFYVLGVVDIESSARPAPGSPGWSCPSRNWQLEMDWVVGKFEN